MLLPPPPPPPPPPLLLLAPEQGSMLFLKRCRPPQLSWRRRPLTFLSCGQNSRHGSGSALISER
jgi:hypothetical protein